MPRGHTSTQAEQVVHAHRVSSNIISPTSAGADEPFLRAPFRARHAGHCFKVSANVLHHVARRERFAGLEGRAFLLTSAARNTRVQFDELPLLELLDPCHADFAGFLDLLDRHWRKPTETFYAGS